MNEQQMIPLTDEARKKLDALFPLADHRETDTNPRDLSTPRTAMGLTAKRADLSTGTRKPTKRERQRGTRR